jgi:cardiolipin synthase
VDRRIAFTGGVGVAEEWEGNARGPSEWRETHFRLRGPVVRGLVGGFLANWLEAGPDGRPPPLAGEPAPADERSGTTPIQVVRSAAAVGWSDIATVLRLLIGLARQRVRICTAYFVPGPMFADALKDARSRGVEVEVMLPALDVVDSRVSRLCSDEEIGPLLEADVKFWSYGRTMLHTKVITVDGCLACIGSANFNQRSIHKDDELSLVVLDRGLTAALDQDFDDDLLNCEPLDLARWKRRGLFRRLLQPLLRPVRQQT